MKRVIMATGLLAAMWAIAAIALSLLWALGIGDDPLMVLAEAPF